MTSTTEPTGGTLPDDLETLIPLIQEHTGDITGITPAARGNAATTLLAQTATGTHFVKAVPNRPGGRRESLVRERLINPFVVPISPAVRWHTEDDEWITLGFEVVEGRSAGFTSGSADLPMIIDLLNRIAELDLPDVASDWPETRWNRFVSDDEAELFAGDTLLIAAGHTAEAAESWAAGCKAWTSANPRAIDIFAEANLRMYRTFAERRSDEPWLKAMAEAAEEWAAHRGVRALS